MRPPADLTPAERRVWRAFPRGEPVDFRQDPGEEPERGGAWGAGRTVRASVLRGLLLGPAEDGEVSALRVTGARISGLLDLQYATVEHPVRLMACHFERAPNLYGARVRQLNLSASYLPALEAATLHVSGVLRITDCRVPGPIRLGGARISGAFFLERAHLGDEDEEQPEVLHLNHSVIEDDVWGPGLVAHGEIQMNGATITGVLNLDDAVLSHPGGSALSAESITVETDVRAVRLRADGRVNLRGARIPGQLDLAHARLSNPNGVALRVTSCTIGELWLRKAAPIEGRVTLRRSHIELLHVTPEVWPDEVMLDGLTFGSLAPHLPARERLAVLGRDKEGYVPYAYEQLTAAYRRAGDDTSARTVQLAKQRRHRAILPRYARTWGYLQDAAVGYGFRPMRATAWLAALLLVGTVAYGTRHPAPLKPGEAPDFNPLFYTLDLLLPIIDFGQEKAFKPAGGHQWLAYLLIVTGWVLATTIAAGITRAISRQ